MKQTLPSSPKTDARNALPRMLEKYVIIFHNEHSNPMQLQCIAQLPMFPSK